MVPVLEIDHQAYPAAFLAASASGGAPLPPCPMPGCGRVMERHAFYERYLGGELVRLLRVRCRVCRVTHAVLPSDVCAYRDLTLPAFEAASDMAVGPTAGARAAALAGPEGSRRVRRMRAHAELALSVVLCALLPTGTGDWLSRARQSTGETPGVLLRLRRWLWGAYGLLLAGPTGLFRHGRPKERVRGPTTDLGKLPPGVRADRPP